MHDSFMEDSLKSNEKGYKMRGSERHKADQFANSNSRWSGNNTSHSVELSAKFQRGRPSFLGSEKKTEERKRATTLEVRGDSAGKDLCYYESHSRI